MGLLSWLFGAKKTVRCTDYVWMSDDYLAAGFLKEIQSTLRSGRPLCVVVHFYDDLIKVLDLLANAGVSAEHWDVRRSMEGALRDMESAREHVLVGQSDKLPMSDGDSFRVPSDRAPAVFVWHHSPTPRGDNAVEQFAAGLDPKIVVRYFTSLAHPLFVRFVGVRILSILEHLGVESDDVIENVTVSSSIKRAQRALERDLRGDERPADSCEEWLTRNLSD